MRNGKIILLVETRKRSKETAAIVEALDTMHALESIDTVVMNSHCEYIPRYLSEHVHAHIPKYAFKKGKICMHE